MSTTSPPQRDCAETRACRQHRASGERPGRCLPSARSRSGGFQTPSVQQPDVSTSSEFECTNEICEAAREAGMDRGTNGNVFAAVPDCSLNLRPHHPPHKTEIEKSINSAPLDLLQRARQFCRSSAPAPTAASDAAYAPEPSHSTVAAQAPRKKRANEDSFESGAKR